MKVQLTSDSGDDYICSIPDSMYEELKEQISVLAELCEAGILP